MSQEKVDRYKEQKLHRKSIMRKEKMMHYVRVTGAAIAAIVIVGWIGFSGYRMYTEGQPRKTTAVDYTAFSDYLMGLGAK